MISVNRASFELIIATIFWGFGFIGARWALDLIGPFWMTGTRFLLAFAVTLPIMLIISKREKLNIWKSTFKLSFWPGFYLALVIILQTWGLKYTTATNAGFITTLYVVFVPILELIVSKKRLDILHIALVLMAVVGTALICQWEANNWNKGDLLTLGCAMARAIHIVCISRYSKKITAPFFFNNFQSLWTGSLAVGLALFTEPFKIGVVNRETLIGFGFLLFGSTLFGFWAQVRAQRVLSANSASLICLLESPFAGLFAYIFLNERLNLLQWLGAGLIMLAAFSTIALETRKLKNKSVHY